MKPSQLLREKGWCQHTSATPDGRICMIEAMVQASDRPVMPIIEKVKKHLHWFDGLSFWNDAPGRTKEEVIAALEAVGA